MNCSSRLQVLVIFTLSSLLIVLGPLITYLSTANDVLHVRSKYSFDRTLLDLWIVCLVANLLALVKHHRLVVLYVSQLVAVVFAVCKGILLEDNHGAILACYLYLVAFLLLPTLVHVVQKLRCGGANSANNIDTDNAAAAAKLEREHSERLLASSSEENIMEEGNGRSSEDHESSLHDTEEKEHSSFSRLTAIAKPETAMLCYASLALLISVTCSLAQPLFFGKIIDAVKDSGDEDTSESHQRNQVNQYCITLIIIFAVGGVFTSIRGYLFSLVGERLVARLRKDLFEHIIRQDIQFFDKNKSGELMNRLASDTTVIQSCLSVNVSMGLRTAVQIFVSVLLLFITSWQLTLVMISVVPLLIFFVRIYGRYTKKLTKEYQDALGRVADTGSESIGSCRIVKSFASEDYECERYFADINTSYAAGARKSKAYGGFIGSVFFVANTVILIVVYYGAVLVIDGTMSVGNLTTFVFYTIYIALGLSVLSGLYTDFMNAVGASERIFQIMDTVPSINTRGGVIPQPPSELSQNVAQEANKSAGTKQDHAETREPSHRTGGRVLFDIKSFSYPSRPDIPVLTNFFLDVKPGQTVAIVGASGGGKSTVFALLERYYELNESDGRIALDDVDIRSLDPRYLHSVVSMVPQEPTLFSGSIWSNITYSSLARDPMGSSVGPTRAEVERAARNANAHEFIMQFPEQYDTVVGERGVRLSGGQKQRIAIARALLSNPRVLLLDEATSALDAESEQLVQLAIENLMASSSSSHEKPSGTTVMIIAHRLSTVRDADVIVMLGRPDSEDEPSDERGDDSDRAQQDGSSIIDAGTHDELLSRCAPYRRLVQRQLAHSHSDSSKHH